MTPATETLKDAAADERVEHLIVLTDRLTAMISRETEAFEARRPQDVAETVSETARLANIYRLESARLKQDPSVLKAASERLRRTLVTSTRAFDTALTRHGQVLEAARTITEGLVHAIAKEVTANRAKPVGYTNRARSTLGDSVAVTLNRRA
jgi:hypothetical protein